MTESIGKVHRDILSELSFNHTFQKISVVGHMNLQHILYFTALLTFGLGDGITGAYMMEKFGAGIELNSFAGHIFSMHGSWTVIAIKIWLVILILFSTYHVQTRKPEKTYWTANGFLIALTVGGLMVINANIAIIKGLVPQPSSEILFLYVLLVLILPEIGSVIDKCTDKRESRRNGGET